MFYRYFGEIIIASIDLDVLFEAVAIGAYGVANGFTLCDCLTLLEDRLSSKSGRLVKFNPGSMLFLPENPAPPPACLADLIYFCIGRDAVNFWYSLNFVAEFGLWKDPLGSAY